MCVTDGLFHECVGFKSIPWELIEFRPEVLNTFSHQHFSNVNSYFFLVWILDKTRYPKIFILGYFLISETV